MAKTNEMTRKEILVAVRNYVPESEEKLLAGIDNFIKSLERKNSKADKEKALANEKLAEDVLIALEEVGETSVSNLIKIGGFDVSTQKMTPILRNLVEKGKVKVEKVKGVNMYSICD